MTYIAHATYIGPDCGWNLTAGMGALIRDSENAECVLAQFDNFYAAKGGVDIAYGWHEFPAEHFKIDEEEI